MPLGSYLGVAWHGPYRNEKAHPAIVTRAEFEAVAIAKTDEPVPPGKFSADALLRGVAPCSGCEKTLKIVPRKRADGSFVRSYY